MTRLLEHLGRIARNRARRRAAIAASVGAVALVAALGAVAYWTTSGSGSASANAGTLTAATISAPSPSGASVTITWTTQAAMTPASQSSNLTYTVERKLGSGSFAAIGSGGCSGSKTFGTSSCVDNAGSSGAYTYRVVADFNGAWTATSNEVSVDVDATAPNVSSIGRASASPTNASTVDWTVTFDENVTGVNAADFALVGAGASGAAITVVSGADDTYTVTTSTGADGSLGLNLVDNDSIVDGVGNKLGGAGAGNGNFTGETYTIDRTAPVVSSSTRDGASPTNAGTVSWTVTFSEPVSGVDGSDFALTTSGLSGSPTVQSVTPIAGATYTVTSTTGTGTPSGPGTLRLDVTDDDSIADALGNKLGGAGTGNGNFVTGQAYTIDKTQPSVTVEQKAGQADPTNALPIRFTVAFSEPVTGFAAGDLTRIGTTTGGSVAVTGSGASYEIVVTNPAATLTNGTIGFTIAASQAIDTAGNDNLASTSVDNQVTYDTVAPVVTLAATGSANGAGWRKAPFTVSASATDGLSGVASCQANVTYSGPDTATGSITRTCSDDAGNVGSATFTFKYDATNPVVTLAASPSSPNGTNGWYKSAVTWTPSQTDATSGPNSCEVAVVYSGPDSATASVIRTCTDNAGNVGSATATFKYDATAPTVTLSPSPSSPNGTNGWYRSAVTWTPSQTDATSGAASCQAPLVYSTPDSATASVTRTCTDNADNVGSASQTFKYDGTAPTGGVTAPSAGASVSGSSVAVTSSSAADAMSNVASVQFQVKPAAGSFTNLAALDTSAPYTTSWDTTLLANGSYVLQAIVIDNAGNSSTTASVNVTVANVYTFVLGTIASQTAGAAFGGFSIQLQINGANSTTFDGTAYTGAKSIVFTGPANAPKGTAPIYPASVTFTNGLGTVTANAITLFKAQTTPLTATQGTITGTSSSFAVGAGTAFGLFYTSSSKDCSAGGVTVGNTGSWSSKISVADIYGNLKSNATGGTVTINIAKNPTTGTGPTPTSLTVLNGATETAGSFTMSIPNGSPPTQNVTATAAGAGAGWATIACAVDK